MGIAVLGALAGQAAPPASDPGWLVPIIVAVLGAGGLLSGAFAWFNRKQTRDSLVSKATSEAVAAAKGMLEEYRVELDRAKEEIADLKDRISALEAELREAREGRELLEAELKAAIERRTRLEERLSELEAIVDRRRLPRSPDQ